MSRSSRSTHQPLIHDSIPRHSRGAKRVRKVGAGERVEVTVVLRPRELPSDHRVMEKARQNFAALPRERTELTTRELRVLHGAHDDDIRMVRQFANDHGLEAARVSPLGNDITLTGSAQRMNRAFRVNLHHYEHRWGRYVSHSGAIHLPRELRPIVRAVLGLDRAPIARRTPPPSPPKPALHSVTDVARAYDFPDGTGRGQRIALLEFGGGYHRSDLREFFSRIGRGAGPRVRSYSVLDATEAPASKAALSAATGAGASNPDPNLFATVETTLDIEIAGAVAPGAQIDVYFAPNDARGYRTAILAALGLHHPGSPRRAATVIAISWGASESEWTPQALEAINGALEKAHAMGVTVCCASGDQGSRGTAPEPALAGVTFPASSPFALACGGTSLYIGDAISEMAWNSMGMASGGGVSGYFARPEWQETVGIPSVSSPGGRTWRSDDRPAAFRGRGVPDVAANADPLNGYEIVVGGTVIPGCGTSAATPLWAGLLALVAEQLGRPTGAISSLLYRPDFARAFTDIVHGNNKLKGSAVRFFRAHPGWNAVTGLGSPKGKRLLAALRG